MRRSINRIVFDIEGNGLLDTISKVWCISFKNIDTQEKKTLALDEVNRESVYEEITKYPRETVKFIGHNIINFDIPLLKMFYDIDLYELVGQENIIDTYIISQTLYPDRPMPKDCPLAIKNPVTNRSKKIGPHGLEAWGWRVGERKLQIHDWTVYTPEIPERCEGDVYINELVYYELMNEASIKL